MKLSAIIAAVRSMLEEPTEDFYTDSEIVNWLNEGLLKIANIARYLKGSNYYELQGIEGEDKLSLPLDCIEVFQVQVNQQRLPKIAMEDDNRVVGYYTWDNYLKLSGVSTGTVDIYFYRRPRLLDLNSLDDEPELPLEFHEALQNYALYKAKLKDQQSGDIFLQLFMQDAGFLKDSAQSVPQKLRFRPRPGR